MTSQLKQLAKDITRAVKEKLHAFGFRKRADSFFTKEWSEETLGWVGLTEIVVRYNSLLEVSPYIGVRNQPLEKVLADLTGQKFHTYNPPTMATQLGYLMPQMDYTSWEFEKHTNIASEVEVMVTAIIDYGQPFIDTHQTLHSLCEAMIDAGYGTCHPYAYRIPTAYFLLGEKKLAKDFLTTQLEELAKKDSLAADDYKQFANKLLNIL